MKKKRRRRERGGRGERGARPIMVQEFARQEHYQEKMFRDCALERDVFGSLVRSLPLSLCSLPFVVFAPRRLPCFILATTLSPDRFPRTTTFHIVFVVVLLLHLFSFNRNVMSVAPAGRRKSARAYSRISSTFL